MTIPHNPKYPPLKRIHGLDVVISSDYPKMQLSKDCPVTPEFRAEINAWMVEFFGVSNVCPDGQFYVIEAHQQIVMNQRTYRQLVEALK